MLTNIHIGAVSECQKYYQHTTTPELLPSLNPDPCTSLGVGATEVQNRGSFCPQCYSLFSQRECLPAPTLCLCNCFLHGLQVALHTYHQQEGDFESRHRKFILLFHAIKPHFVFINMTLKQYKIWIIKEVLKPIQNF